MNNRIRGFIKTEDIDSIKLPQRSTKNSAGFDFFVPCDVEIKSHLIDFVKIAFKSIFGIKKNNLCNLKPDLIPTGIKSYMQNDEVLELYNRSSNPLKFGLILANGVGVVDSDYSGEIKFMFYNLSPVTIRFKKGDKIGQGVFKKYLLADNDETNDEIIEKRQGGFGSTGK